MPTYIPLYFDWNTGEIRQVPQGETLVASSVAYYVIFSEPTLEWRIPHKLGKYLPMVSYQLFGPNGTMMMAGIDPVRSDTEQTTLLLTQPMSGFLTYQIFE